MTMPRLRFPILGLALLASGCGSVQFSTLTIYETPSTYVRLEVDRTFGKNHSHPSPLTPEQLGAALRGIVIEERLARIPYVDDTSLPRRHPVFTDEEAALFSTLAAIALKSATPEELVTFYRSIPPTGIRREVTSGGLFVDNDELHLVIANYRSPTHYMPDPQMADTPDDRRVPMESIAPQRGPLDFEPKEARLQPSTNAFGKLVQWDRRELIVLWRKLPSRADQPDRPKE